MESFLHLMCLSLICGAVTTSATADREALTGDADRLAAMLRRALGDVGRLLEDVRLLQTAQETLAAAVEGNTVQQNLQCTELKTEVLTNRNSITETRLAVVEHGHKIEEAMKSLKAIEDKLENHNNPEAIDDNPRTLKSIMYPRDCADVQRSGETVSGVYTVYINPNITTACDDTHSLQPIQVYCDLDTAGGGWTVMLRRVDHSNFHNKDWDEYATGFGSLCSSFYLGNEKVHLLTSRNVMYTLRFDLKDWSGYSTYAEYQEFSLGPAADKYRIHASGYSGTAGDSFSYHSGQAFSTHFHDNDESTSNCARVYSPGWHKSCLYVTLMGHYYVSTHGKGDYQGITWHHFKGPDYSLMRAEMKFRPANFEATK